MAMAMSLQAFLDDHALQYETLSHEHAESGMRNASTAHQRGDSVAKAVLLKNEEKFLLTVLPVTHRLDLGRLHHLLNRHVGLATEGEVTEIFSDCETGAIPPTGLLYDIDTIVDEALLNNTDIYFEAGDHEHLVHMNRQDFSKLMGDAVQMQISHHV